MKKLFGLPDYAGGVESLLIPAYYENEKWSLAGRLIRSAFVLALFLFLFILALPLSGGMFFRARNLGSLNNQILPIVLAGSVMVFLFARGGLDLSFFANGALSGTVFALALNGGVPLPVALLMALFFGTVVGLLNGMAVGLLRVPGVVVTLIVGVFARMFSLALMQGRTLVLEADPGALMVFFKITKGLGWFLGLILFAAAAVLYYFPSVIGKRLDQKGEGSFGRKAVTAGLPYLVSGFAAALAGVVLTLYLRAATPGMGQNGELDILFLLIIGGTVLGSRKGNPAGVFLAALSLGVFRNLMSLRSTPFWMTLLLIVLMVVQVLVFNVLYEAAVSWYYRKKTAVNAPVSAATGSV